jgi:hypothetical protein
MPYTKAKHRIYAKEVWYPKNKEKKKAYDRIHKKLPSVRSRNAELRRIRVSRNRLFLIKTKDQPCSDCKKQFPSYVMDFDHKKDKKFDVSRLVNLNVSLKTITAEIEKCELVCANCHRIRTFKRRGIE